VTRRDAGLRITTFDDPRLRRLRIGVHVVGDDYANVPPAQALTARGIIQNIRGFSIYGNYAKPNPPADLITAVSDRSIDVAIAWGPLAGYFGALSRTPLVVSPAAAQVDRASASLAFDIAMAVRRDDKAFKDALDAVIVRHHADIRRLLAQYHVPIVAHPGSQSNDH
jgi:mxaJ protein